MEQLPDELLLLIFSYLHKFDIFYSFGNLNLRFQQITISYFHHLDLGCVTTDQFKLFCRCLLPLHSRSIQSLVIKGTQRLKLFKDYLMTLQSTLKSLTLIDDYGSICTDVKDTDFYVEQLTYFCQLTHLRTNFRDYVWHNQNRQLQTVKSLTISVNRLDHLFDVFRIFINLEELNLCMADFTPQSYEYIENLQIPKSLTKLYLEAGHVRSTSSSETASLPTDLFQRRRGFLELFTNQLTSFTVKITTNDLKLATSENFKMLKDTLSPLGTFHYSVTTLHNTIWPWLSPRRITTIASNSFQQKRVTDCLQHGHPYYYTLYSNSDSTLFQTIDLYRATILNLHRCTLEQCYNIKFHLPNLRTIELLEAKIDNYRLLSHILSLSPNVHILQLGFKNSKDIINLLQEMALLFKTRIDDLTCIQMNTIHWTFLVDLADIHPKLKQLSIGEISDGYLPPEKILSELEKYCLYLQQTQLFAKIEKNALEEFKLLLEKKNISYSVTGQPKSISPVKFTIQY